MHYHTSQIVFYILQGTMSVQDQGKPATTFKAGDTLLIRPGTVNEHWNASDTEPLVFLEERGRRDSGGDVSNRTLSEGSPHEHAWKNPLFSGIYLEWCRAPAGSLSDPADAWAMARSQRSSSMRARIIAKSSAARGRVTFSSHPIWAISG